MRIALKSGRAADARRDVRLLALAEVLGGAGHVATLPSTSEPATGVDLVIYADAAAAADDLGGHAAGHGTASVVVVEPRGEGNRRVTAADAPRLYLGAVPSFGLRAIDHVMAVPLWSGILQAVPPLIEAVRPRVLIDGRDVADAAKLAEAFLAVEGAPWEVWCATPQRLAPWMRPDFLLEAIAAEDLARVYRGCDVVIAPPGWHHPSHAWEMTACGASVCAAAEDGRAEPPVRAADWTAAPLRSTLEAVLAERSGERPARRPPPVDMHALNAWLEEVRRRAPAFELRRRGAIGTSDQKPPSIERLPDRGFAAEGWAVSRRTGAPVSSLELSTGAKTWRARVEPLVRADAFAAHPQAKHDRVGLIFGFAGPEAPEPPLIVVAEAGGERTPLSLSYFPAFSKLGVHDPTSRQAEWTEQLAIHIDACERLYAVRLLIAEALLHEHDELVITLDGEPPSSRLMRTLFLRTASDPETLAPLPARTSLDLGGVSTLIVQTRDLRSGGSDGGVILFGARLDRATGVRLGA